MSDRFSVIVPAATTNDCFNPSFEIDTTDWSATATNTIALSDDYQYKGAYSLKCTWGNNTSMATVALTTSTAAAGTVAYLSFYVYVPTVWDGGNIQMEDTGWGAAVTTTTTKWLSASDPRDKWFRVLGNVTVPTGDTTGSIIIQTSANPTTAGTGVIYIDCFQCEIAPGTHTTYTDGDQPGGEWQGKRHYSRTKRKSTSKAGGTNSLFATDLSFYVNQRLGAGKAPVANAMLPLVTGGTDYKRTISEDRVMTLSGTLSGATLNGLDSIRDAIVSKFDVDGVWPQQKTILRYDDGTNNVKYLPVLLNTGFEIGRQEGWTERFALQFIGDPYWIEEVQQGVVIPSLDSTTISAAASLVERDTDLTWTDAGGGITTATSVDALYYSPIDNKLYVGGNFTQVGGSVTCDDIAVWDEVSWTAPNLTVAGGNVFCFVETPDGKMAVGGSFTSIDAVANTGGVAIWDKATTFTTTAGTGPVTGGSAKVNAMVYDADGNLFIGGSFTNIDGSTANNVAKLSGGAWSVLNSGATKGVNNDVYALAVSGDTLYIGGAFTQAGGSAATYLVKYSISGDSFTAFTNQPDAAVNALAYDSRAGGLIIGGDFSNIGSTGFKKIARYDGVNFGQMADGFTGGNVDTVDIDANGVVYAGGDFTNVSDTGIDLLDDVAYFVGNAWLPFDINVGAFSVVKKVAASKAYPNNRQNKKIAYIGSAVTSGPANIPGEASVTNRGTAPCYPVFRIVGTSLEKILYRITNKTTGQSIFFKNFTLRIDEEIILDLANQSFISNQRGNIRDFILLGSSQETFRILPNVSNTFSMFTNSTDVTTTAYWDVAHMGIEGI